MDVKKLSRIPDGGGWCVHGRDSEQGRTSKLFAQHHRLGHAYLHTVLDGHSRLAYTEILTGEQASTTAAFLHRAHAWSAASPTSSATSATTAYGSCSVEGGTA
jgi:hypothetical protein